jgi:hypothetical protein
MRSGDTMCASLSTGDRQVAEFVPHVIRMCHADKTDHITIAGRRAIQTVLDLCRRGYMHVMCRTATPGPHCSENSADSLWILNVPSETELRTHIVELAPNLRKGGSLIVGFEVSISSDHAARLKRVLLSSGFLTVQQQKDKHGRTLLICGRQEPRAQAQAA